MIYHFDRYRNGQLMAMGVTITKATDEQDALERARELCPAEPGEVITFALKTEGLMEGNGNG